MILNLGMEHQGMELYKFIINHEPGMILTDCTGNTSWKWTNGHDIYDSKNEIAPRGSSFPARGCHYMTKIVKHVYWYISQISGERLQDHWSSVVFFFFFFFFLFCFCFFVFFYIYIYICAKTVCFFRKQLTCCL